MGERCLKHQLMCQQLRAQTTDSPAAAALRGRRQRPVTSMLTPPEGNCFALLSPRHKSVFPVSHPPPDVALAARWGSPPGWGCLRGAPSPGSWSCCRGGDLTQPTGIQSSKARRMLTAVGAFPDTPSQRTCESWALPALHWEPASHTHTLICP